MIFLCSLQIYSTYPPVSAMEDGPFLDDFPNKTSIHRILPQPCLITRGYIVLFVNFAFPPIFHNFPICPILSLPKPRPGAGWIFCLVTKMPRSNCVIRTPMSGRSSKGAYRSGRRDTTRLGECRTVSELESGH